MYLKILFLFVDTYISPSRLILNIDKKEQKNGYLSPKSNLLAFNDGSCSSNIYNTPQNHLIDLNNKSESPLKKYSNASCNYNGAKNCDKNTYNDYNSELDKNSKLKEQIKATINNTNFKNKLGLTAFYNTTNNNNIKEVENCNLDVLSSYIHTLSSINAKLVVKQDKEKTNNSIFDKILHRKGLSYDFNVKNFQNVNNIFLKCFIFRHLNFLKKTK